MRFDEFVFFFCSKLGSSVDVCLFRARRNILKKKKELILCRDVIGILIFFSFPFFDPRKEEEKQW